MGTARGAGPVKLVCAVLAGRREWLDAAAEALRREFGEMDLSSDIWPFDCTRYYEPQMGSGLLRRIHSFAELVDPARLAAVKLATNALEARLAAELRGGPPRPVNLDPGYVSESKLVLATTKDYSHRVYLGNGIYAEVTLRWRAGRFEPWDWTYPDYRTEPYRAFFAGVRELYMAQRRGDGR